MVFVATARDRLLRKRLAALANLQPQNLEVPIKVPAAGMCNYCDVETIHFDN